jgi:hypothetical protein
MYKKSCSMSLQLAGPVFFSRSPKYISARKSCPEVVPGQGPERYVLPVSGTIATETAETMKQSDDEGAIRASGWGG